MLCVSMCYRHYLLFIFACMKNIARWASLVKFAHTVFALPFALLGYVYALTHTGTPFSWLLLIEILLCMVFARNAAMGFNRWADRKFDAENPRTAQRDIPAGRISPRAALLFVVVNVVGFMVVAGFINRLTLLLSPVALTVILGYSYTKRFTALSHIVLGVALAIAPVGAYVAVAGSFDSAMFILAAVVVTWVSGFDILYSLQDAAHDRDHGLHSIPAYFSPVATLAISIALHILTLAGVGAFGLMTGGRGLYWTGAVLFALILTAQHLLNTPRYALMFTVLNGASSIVLAAFAIAGMLC